MSGSIRLCFFTAAVICAAAVFLSAPARAVTVLGIRSGDDPARTRLVLDLDGTAQEVALERKGTTEWTVQLPSYALASTIPAKLSPVGRIASGEFASEGRLTLTLRFRRPCRVETFALENPPRLVLDVSETMEQTEEAEGEAEVGTAREPSTLGEAPQASPLESVDPAPEPKRTGPRIVVIDAGHGGDDPGATGPGVREKDVCLDVARRLHKELAAREGIQPLLTRSRDVFLPLRSRMQVAEEADADLFVSIHVNAAPSANADGVEVFFLSIGGASDEAARELARYENDPVDSGETDMGSSGEIPFSLSLRQSDTLLRSSRAAEVVLDLFVDRHLARNRGVRQANFSVLRSYQVPSILVELGFVSSPSDREKLASAEHRARLASALADGILRYFEEYAPLRRDQAR